MAIQEIELGAAPSGADGDVAREAFTKVNANFEELDQRAAQAQTSAEAGQQAALEAQQTANGAVQTGNGNTQAITALTERVVELEEEPVGQVDTVAGVGPDGNRNVPVGGLSQALGVPNKVDKIPGMGLSEASFTAEEKAKLAGLEASRYKGVFLSLAALQAALPTATAGDYAQVDAGSGSDTILYLWDATDSKWVASGAGAPLTAAEVKALYESNADTNALTNALKAKLDGIAAGATANTNTDSLAEGGTNLWFTTSRVRNTALAGFAAAATKAAIVASDSVLLAFGKVQKWLSDLDVAVAAKLTSPMTASGDLIKGGTAGAAERLPVGTNGQVLKVVSGAPAWAAENAGMANPMTTLNDLIVGGAAGTPIRLPKGDTTQVVGVKSDGSVGYMNLPFLNMDYLIVAGGGSGGCANNTAYGGGGGGAGGVRTANALINAGISLPVVVGSGGAGLTQSSGGGNGNNGGDSSFNGVVSIGGGGGGGYPSTGGGRAGGSGGGGQNYATAGGSGTAGQGNNGGASPGNGVAGGGGGAGAVGSPGVAPNSGKGGDGIQSSISGTNTYYGGGGGGGGYNGAQLSGAGGLGGGGAGGGAAGTSAGGLSGQNGTPNTGGGGGANNGGGSSNTGVSGSGGSGVVIVRYLGAPRATGGTITQVGGYTIHTFTASGTLTISLMRPPMRYAIVEDGRVVNVVESDEALFDNWIPSDSASIDEVFDGESFAPPPITAADIGAHRYQVETAGVIWQGFGIATDDRSQAKLQAERAAARDGLRTNGAAWKCLELESGAVTFRPTTNDEIIEIADQAYRYIAACYAREEALLALGEAVTSQDLKEGWPANG